VAVYRPPGYVATGRPYPAAFFNDGSLMVETGELPAVLDRLIAAKRIAPIVAVFVDPVSRVDDYKMSDDFRKLFSEELVPWVEHELHISPEPDQRAVIGVSRGAIGALDLSWFHPEQFGLCGVLLPSTQPTSITALIAGSPKRHIRYSVVTAWYDARWRDDGQELMSTLRSRRYEVTYRNVPEGHGPQTWRRHMSSVLADFFPIALGPN